MDQHPIDQGFYSSVCSALLDCYMEIQFTFDVRNFSLHILILDIQTTMQGYLQENLHTLFCVVFLQINHYHALCKDYQQKTAIWGEKEP